MTLFSAHFRKAEFSLGLLIEAGYLQDDTSAKQYYTRSAMKNFPPAQVQLALILLKDNSPEGITWLNNAAKLVKKKNKINVQQSSDFFFFLVQL